MTHILIAEDDQFLANAYRVKFEKEQFQVTIAFNGEEALAAIAKDQPDLIILDLIMPVKDGFTTISEIKANPAWKNIPIIVTSNLSQESDYQKAKELGATEYFVKSNTPLSEIANLVKKYTMQTS